MPDDDFMSKLQRFAKQVDGGMKDRQAAAASRSTSVTCKHCGNLLIMNLNNKCRFCGKKAGMFRAAKGTQTLTQRGAQKFVEKQTRSVERSVRSDMQRMAAANPDVDVAGLYAQSNILHGMSWQGAERLACEWMRKNRYRDAKVTPAGTDGGVDVVSAKAIAQVKHHQSPVGIGEMQRIFGIATSTHKKALFFAASGYTAKAKEFAKRHKIECYQYPPVRRII